MQFYRYSTIRARRERYRLNFKKTFADKALTTATHTPLLPTGTEYLYLRAKRVHIAPFVGIPPRSGSALLQAVPSVGALMYFRTTTTTVIDGVRTGKKKTRPTRVNKNGCRNVSVRFEMFASAPA